jgi:hypothetical protein
MNVASSVLNRIYCRVDEIMTLCGLQVSYYYGMSVSNVAESPPVLPAARVASAPSRLPGTNT